MDGHKRLSVLLDTYAGVLHGDELVALQRIDQLLDRFYDEARRHSDDTTHGKGGHQRHTGYTTTMGS